MTIPDRYLSPHYLRENPSWDMEDSPWKANIVARILSQNHILPKTVCEIGCGAGGVLATLRDSLPDAELVGFDIAPDVEKFWDAHAGRNIQFQVGDFLALNDRQHDLILLLDVLEHIADPWNFLSGVKGSGKFYVIHFPLDLSAISVLREQPLLYVRRKVGHIHYFTCKLALELLNECGFEVISSNFTGASLSGPQVSLATRFARLPRRVVYKLLGDLGVRLLGGETLLVLAREK